MRKHLLALFAFIFIVSTFVASAIAHEFDSLGVLVRHKQNTVSLIAAPPLSALAFNQQGEKLNFDSNGDGDISFEEIRSFENEIIKQVKRLVIFRDEQGRVATLQSFRLLEKGYENLLKIAEPDNQDPVNKKLLNHRQNTQENNDASYIQLSLKFTWDKSPQAIHLSYGLLAAAQKHVLVRDQNNASSTVLLLAPDNVAMTVFPITSNAQTKAVWWLGIEHVLAGLDHLLFILALVLVCKNWLALIAPLSAFTLTHSLALVLVALGMQINIASWLIEAAIALTIVVMALFELLGWQPKRLFLVTALMGGIHGFGLGQALTDSIGGVEGWAIALLQVTVGIELAQLAIAMTLLVFLIHAPKLVKISRQKLAFILSHAIIVVGLFWTLERVL